MKLSTGSHVLKIKDSFPADNNKSKKDMVIEKIKKKALELSDKERAQLAHVLIDSLQKEEAFDSEEAWSKELKDRIDRFEKGESSARSWDEVKGKAQSRVD
jgi:putative addiction module component (TIGR02574 family)